MPDNLPIPATTVAPAKIGRVRYKRQCCAGCRHFRARKPTERWPIGGVDAGAEGKCLVKTMNPEAFGKWRRGRDWCNQWTEPGEEVRRPPPKTDIPPRYGIVEARKQAAERIRLLKGARA